MSSTALTTAASAKDYCADTALTATMNFADFMSNNVPGAMTVFKKAAEWDGQITGASDAKFLKAAGESTI